MPTFQQSLRALSAATQATMAALIARLLAGDVDEQQTHELAAALVATANMHALTLADIALAARLTQLGRPSTPVGLIPAEGEADRIGKAIATALFGDNRESSLDLIARAEPLQAGQHGMNDGIRAHEVEGWRRVTGGKSCRVCSDLAAADFIPASVTMWHHPGCGCHPDPVLETTR